jgi:hypothetical protein
MLQHSTSEEKTMQTILKATAGNIGLMAQEDKIKHSGGGRDGSAAREVSLSDGTGEGNVPIEGTSASSDPEVLAGTEGEATVTSLNDDDYPENIAEAAGAVDDASEDVSVADASGTGDNSQPPYNEASTSGETTMPEEAAGVDLSNRSVTPDAPGKK